jgi:hypothetical protein
LPVNIDAVVTHYLAAPETGAVRRSAERLGAVATFARIITTGRRDFQNWRDWGYFREEKVVKIAFSVDPTLNYNGMLLHG